MSDGKQLLTRELIQDIEEAARTQNREPAEVLRDAVTQYLEQQSWVEFVARNERRARAMGITEEDVPGFVAEVRAEKRR